MTIVDNFTIGDKVKLSETYIFAYSPKWVDSVKDKIAVIKSIKQKIIKFTSLDKEDKPVYRNRYGQQNEYTLFELLIQFNGTEDLYMVSQFGVDNV